MTEILTATVAAAQEDREDFQRYYEEAGPDYAAWSAGFNMHFGFYRWGMNPLKREAMLERMNAEIFERLLLERITPGSDPDGTGTLGSARILDMGCGLGATLRSFARRAAGAELFGITLVPWQLDQGRELNRAGDNDARITLALGDYEHTEFPAASFDAVYALESSCYAHGASKSAFLKEAHRLLRRGGRVVIADGFIGPGRLRGPQRRILRRLCDCWVIDTLGEVNKVAAEMERVGFRNVVVEQIQARVAPSVMHVPWVTLKFLLTSVVFGARKMTRARWNNVLAPILLPFVGFPLGPVAYYIVSATRD